MTNYTNSSLENEKLGKLQILIITIAPCITGILSLLGSSAIIYNILSVGSRQTSKTFLRLMLAMSIIDVFNSLAHSLSTLPSPKDDAQNIFGAQGNISTCEVQGFFILIGFAVPMYNSALCVYYLLVIKYQCSEKDICRFRLLPITHSIIILFTTTMAFVALWRDLINTNGLICNINASPFGCFQNDEIDCVRPANMTRQSVYIFFFIQNFIPLGLCLLTTLLTMPIIFFSVREREVKMHKSYSFGRDISSRSKHLQLRSSHLHKVRRNVGIQAFMYIGAFLLSFIFPVLNLILFTRNGRLSYEMQLLSRIFFPMQGFFNFCIYFRPRYISSHRENPGKSFCWIIQSIILGRNPRLNECSSCMTRVPHNVRETSNPPRGAYPEDDILHVQEEVKKYLDEYGENSGADMSQI